MNRITLVVTTVFIGTALITAAFFAGVSYGEKSAKDGAPRALTASERAKLVQWVNFSPDTVMSTLRTKHGQMAVTWESMGEAQQPNMPEDGVTKKYGRYPRYFQCTIALNAGTSGDGLDLYDIGVQRHKDPIYMRLKPNQSNLTNVVVWDASRNTAIPADGDDVYEIPAALYDRERDNHQGNGSGDRPTRRVWLRFSGGPCVIQMYRDIHKPDEGEGSPPPPDPGNNSSELP